MARRVLTFLMLAGLVGAGVVGCSQVRREQRAEWRGEAERACMRSGRVRENQHIKVASALNGPGMCGADMPFRVSAFSMQSLFTASAPGILSGGGGVLTRLNQQATLTCPMTAALSDWLERVVQPAAMARFGQPVIEVRTMGSYACRSMNHQRGARLSEHAFANAIDIGGFRLADGSVVTLSKDWKGGALPVQFFLREVHAGACRFFSTVLGPGYNALHHDHFHFDMARHGRSGKISVCRPNPESVPPPQERFPIDPAGRSGETPTARAPSPPPATAAALANAGPRPVPLPESRALAYARALRPPAPVGAPAPQARVPSAPAVQNGPLVLYGEGQGPFTPGREEDIDPGDLDPYTGSIGE
jgi:hypothetical protein